MCFQWTYACYIIFLVYNVLIAIIVDGYEDAKDLDLNKRNAEEEAGDQTLKLSHLFGGMVTQVRT